MILAKLREGRCTPRYLSNELGKSQPYINQRLKALKSNDHVIKIDRGLYVHDKLATKKLDASKKIRELTNDELLYLSDESHRNVYSDPQNSQKVSEETLNYLRRKIKEEIPRSSDAREIIIDSIHILNRKGKTPRSKLEQELYSKYPDSYKTSAALWNSTVGHKYENIPGLQKTDDGLYYFNEKYIDMNSGASEDLNQWSE